MITLFSGTPGSGKSLDMANEIRLALNKPRGEDMPVIANFPVNLDRVKRPQAFHYVPNHELTPDLLTSFADSFWASTDRPFSEDYLLLALDEVQILHNSRNWQTKGRAGRNDSRMDWLEFFSQTSSTAKYAKKIPSMSPTGISQLSHASPVCKSLEPCKTSVNGESGRTSLKNPSIPESREASQDNITYHVQS